MASSDIHITVEIDPIVKVVCMARTCKFNLDYSCGLKHIRISEQTTECMEYERREAKQEVDNART